VKWLVLKEKEYVRYFDPSQSRVRDRLWRAGPTSHTAFVGGRSVPRPERRRGGSQPRGVCAVCSRPRGMCAVCRVAFVS